MKRKLARLTVLGVAALSACGGDGPTTPGVFPMPRTVDVVEVTPANASILASETVQLSATPRDAQGNALSGRAVTWRSSNTSAATVSSTGLVTGVAAGSPTITATSEGIDGSASVTVRPNNLTIDVSNNLLSPVEIDINGVFIGTVPGESSGQFLIPAVSSFTLSFDMVRVRAGATEIGERIAGVFGLVTVGLESGFSFQIDNIVGSTTYFAPLVSNRTSVQLLMAVNRGLGSVQNLCPCLLNPNTEKVYFGYYVLVNNSNVRAYAAGSNHSGSFIFWPATGEPPLFTLVQSGSGVLDFLVTTIAPGPGPVAMPGGMGLVKGQSKQPSNQGSVITNDQLPRRE